MNTLTVLMIISWGATTVSVVLLAAQLFRYYLLVRTPPNFSDPRVKLVHNERVKLQATILNTIGAGLVVTGVIGPIATYLYGTTAETRHEPWQIGAEIFGLLLSGVVLHALANVALGRLQP